ncbi:BrnA antitoxin family protein [Pseudodesulfovibrio portus]|uniref:BrnA antitoxin of type II toxin-antitoxin system n=1 Tax=Pseudodesulfovibrio portus TaxID=231439 RepID=A0ABN6RTJ9_9BACT|nr:BrnA antitoxin family protein [Pseudodesulfovibrio portus]BDQ32661.1 hypothetical protein JCM14722_02030 [Pseudodesulfovibrio portus]
MSPKNLIVHESDPEEQAAKFAKKALEALTFKKNQKAPLSIRLDTDVLEYLKLMTNGKYQPAINTILRVYMEYPLDRLAEALGEDTHPLQHSKKPTSIRLDEDVLSWFKNGGDGYQTRINQVLRAFIVFSKADG